ncbi:MAG: hypothetical protein LBI13_10135 [Streptococcaceae bacterium]|jgi:hypothetical protein|nr:hypothetical protein [Streptococcaceae bacterium]
MKAKLGEEIVNAWQISVENPGDDHWVAEYFKKKQLCWSGALVMTAHEKQELREKGLTSPEVSQTEKAMSWLLAYMTPSSLASAYPYNIYLIVTAARTPIIGQVGEWLIKQPDGSFAIYSEKKFEKELELI